MAKPRRRPNIVVMLWRGHLVWFLPFDEHGYHAAMSEPDDLLCTKVRHCMPKRGTPDEFAKVLK